jgi:membrane protease YdiL (CAAX protease family)
VKNNFTSLISFLKCPCKPVAYTPIKAGDFFALLVLTLIIIIPYAWIVEAAGIDQFDSILDDLLKENKLVVGISAIFLAPVLEEPIFRLHLDLKKSSIWWGIGLSGLFLGEMWWLIIVFWLYLFFLMYKVSNGNQPNLRYVLWVSAIFFALVHLGNFTNFDYILHFYWIPFMVGSQLLGGLVLSYIRLNHGIKWAIVFHGAYNAVLVIPAIYLYEG